MLSCFPYFLELHYQNKQCSCTCTISIVWLQRSYICISGRVSSCYSLETKSKKHTKYDENKNFKHQSLFRIHISEKSHRQVLITKIIKEDFSQNDTYDSETVLLPLHQLHDSCQQVHNHCHWLLSVRLSSPWKLHPRLDWGGCQGQYLWSIHSTMYQSLYTKNW